MIVVYVETNFLLNLALKQENNFYARKLLRLATESKISLKIPSQCYSESYSSLFSAHGDLKKYKEDSIYRLTQMGRSTLHRSNYEQYKNIPAVIDAMSLKETTRLDNELTRIFKIVTFLPVSRKSHMRGLVFRKKLDIAHEIDASIVATIEEDIKRLSPRTKRIFVTLDNKSILKKPEVKRFMSNIHCKPFSNFKEAFLYLNR